MRGNNRGLWALLGLFALIALLVPLFAGGWGMMGPGRMWGPGGPREPGWGGAAGWGLWMLLGWLSMIAFWGAVIVGILLLVRALVGPERRAEDPAIEVLRRRYAAGEITREQYEEMRADLEDVGSKVKGH